MSGNGSRTWGVRCWGAAGHPTLERIPQTPKPLGPHVGHRGPQADHPGIHRNHRSPRVVDRSSPGSARVGPFVATGSPTSGLELGPFQAIPSRQSKHQAAVHSMPRRAVISVIMTPRPIGDEPGHRDGGLSPHGQAICARVTTCSRSTRAIRATESRTSRATRSVAIPIFLSAGFVSGLRLCSNGEVLEMGKSSIGLNQYG